MRCPWPPDLARVLIDLFDWACSPLFTGPVCHSWLGLRATFYLIRFWYQDRVGARLICLLTESLSQSVLFLTGSLFDGFILTAVKLYFLRKSEILKIGFLTGIATIGEYPGLHSRLWLWKNQDSVEAAVSLRYFIGLCIVVIWIVLEQQISKLSTSLYCAYPTHSISNIPI